MSTANGESPTGAENVVWNKDNGDNVKPPETNLDVHNNKNKLKMCYQPCTK